MPSESYNETFLGNATVPGGATKAPPSAKAPPKAVGHPNIQTNSGTDNLRAEQKTLQGEAKGQASSAPKRWPSGVDSFDDDAI